MKLRRRDRLCLMTDANVASRPLTQIIREAVEAGVGLVQLREKALSDDDYLALADPIRAITAAYDARLLLNTRWRFVARIGADGAHLPERASIGEARDALGDDLLIGYSAHSAEGLERAERDGADFATLSPVFPTSSKPTANPLGLRRFARMARGRDLPAYALGGVTPDTTRACVEAGAFGVAVLSPLMRAENVSETVRQYLNVLGGSVRLF